MPHRDCQRRELVLVDEDVVEPQAEVEDREVLEVLEIIKTSSPAPCPFLLSWTHYISRNRDHFRLCIVTNANLIASVSLWPAKHAVTQSDALRGRG